MTKITLGTVGDLRNTTTAQTVINTNFDTIEAAWDNTLSRDGTSPNTMAANLDMNSNRILNLPLPVNISEPLRLGDITDITGTFITATTGTSGHTVPYLDGNNTWSGTNTYQIVSGNAINVGRLGSTNPAFTVDTSAASQATGLRINAQAAGNGLSLVTSSSGTNESFTLDAKGSGTIVLNGIATGSVSIGASGRFTVNPANGFVGIGNGPSASEALVIQSAGGSVNQLKVRNTGNTGTIFSQNSSGQCIFLQQDNQNMQFFTNNGSGEQMILGIAGNGLQIGPGAPNAGTGGLGVVGNFVANGTGTIATANANLNLNGQKGGGNAWVIQTVDADGRFRILNNTNSVEVVSVTQAALATAVVNIFATTDSGNSSTGSLVTSGGIGCSKNLVGGALILAQTGIGYSTGNGSGGTVTQATSRTTGVTLNKTAGEIVLFSQVNTAVSLATAQTFTVTNSTVAATDNIVVHQKTGTDKYHVFVTNVTAGSFQITDYTTGGVTNEAPKFQFSVIKSSIT